MQFTIRQAHLPHDLASLDALFWEYLQWTDQQLQDTLKIQLDMQHFHRESLAHLDVYLPPTGALLLASVDTDPTQLAGVGCIRATQPYICEIKRMYVRPKYQRNGLGRTLLRDLFQHARRLGYTCIRLDSIECMTSAHALYRSEGFTEIEPYPECEITPEYWEHWVFMERSLCEVDAGEKRPSRRM